MHTSRRQFLQLAGGIAGAGLLISSCKKVTPASTIFVGSGDRALLNYLLIVAEVQTNFYTQAAHTEYYGCTAMELEFLKDLRDEHLAHKEWLKAILTTGAIPDIVTDLSAVTFADRNSTLNHAIVFEDIATGAYNGALQYFSDTSYISALSKIASVEGRHAAYVRDVLTPNSFGDSTVISTSGLDQALTPKTVMTLLAPYIQTTFDASQLPA